MFPKIETLGEAKERNIEDALFEDIGTGCLSKFLIYPDNSIANIFCKDEAVLCGVDWCSGCFKKIDPNIQIKWFKSDGDVIKVNELVCKITGDSRAILEAERSALNFLQLLSGTATETSKFVKSLKSLNVGKPPSILLDTRKTLPGLRLAQKYAVKVGGGKNQRLGLWDNILLKENHLKCLDGINGLKKRLEFTNKNSNTGFSKIESLQVEVETLEEMRVALSMGIKNILLDNFTTELIVKALKINKNRAILEVSGGVDINNFKSIAETGVHQISIGHLTKNVRAIDFTLLIEKFGKK